MIELEPGHDYKLRHLGSSGYERLRFIKRSSGVVFYGHQVHPGTNSQEVTRVLIRRTAFLHGILPCSETEAALWHYRMALYMYEVRALRRKREEANKTARIHTEEDRLSAWRDGFKDIPFNEQNIEWRPVGVDGHILLSVEERQLEEARRDSIRRSYSRAG